MKTFTITIQLLLLLPLHAYSQTMPGTVPDSPRAQFQNASDMLAEADKARDNGLYAEAIEIYGKALNAYSEFNDLHPNWKPALTKFRRRYCGEQIEALKKEIDSGRMSTGPSNTKIQIEARRKQPCAMAMKLLNDGQIKAAYDLLLENMQAHPDHIQTRFMLGVIHCRMEKFQNAILLLEPLTEESPDMAQAYVALAAAYAGANRPSDAESALKKAIKIDPSIAEPHYNMALVQLQKKDPDKAAAKKHYARSLELGGTRNKELEKSFLETQ
ncbi:MAG: tetratricopeptide repeat protein [Verrucomicrobiota bacterium]